MKDKMAILMIVMLMMSAIVPIVSAQMPVTIKGKVTFDDGSGVGKGWLVDVTNLNTGELLGAKTTTIGSDYNVATEPPMLNVGDEIEVVAKNDSWTGVATHVIQTGENVAGGFIWINVTVTMPDTDTTLPETTHTVTPTPNENDWNDATPVTVTFFRSDDDSGVAYTNCSLSDQGPPWTMIYANGSGMIKDLAGIGSENITVNNTPPYNFTIKITGEGVHTIWYYSVDNERNEEDKQNVTVKIDTKKPEVSSATAEPDTIVANVTTTLLNVTALDLGGSDIEKVTVDLSAIGGSPTQELSYTDTCAAWQYTTEATIAAGEVNLPVNASDNAGNFNNTVNISLTVEAERHDVEVDWIKIYDGAVLIEGNLTINKTYQIRYKIKNLGNCGPETVNITAKISNGTSWDVTIADYQKDINKHHINSTTTWDTTGLAEDDYTITVNVTIPNDANPDDNERTRDVVLEMVAPTPKPDLIVTSIDPNPQHSSGHRYLFANETNTIRATIENIGGEDAGRFNVSFAIDGYYNEVRVNNLSAGLSTYVSIDDYQPAAPGAIAVDVTADCNGEVTESDEINNATSEDMTVYNSGYKGKRYTGGDDITTASSYTINGDLIYSIGNSTYQAGGGESYAVSWIAGDLQVPSGATIADARLYLYYNWDKTLSIMDYLKMSFDGTLVSPDRIYTDRKSYGGWDIPSGVVAYDVTALFNPSGNEAIVTSSYSDPSKNPAYYGMLLAVVYEESGESEKMIWINEECDLLYANDGYGVSSEEATAYAPFAGTIDLSKVEKAKLITIVPAGDSGDTNNNKLLFNGCEWGNVYNGSGGHEISIDEQDVKACLGSDGNEAGIQSYIGDEQTKGDYMTAANAFLVVEYEEAAQPDLAITEKSEEWNDQVNKTYNITYTVKNIGDGDASESNTTITIDGVDVIEDPVPALAAGTSHTATLGPFTMSGDGDTVLACADNDNEIDESNEMNNCLENTFTFEGKPDFTVTGITTPTNIRAEVINPITAVVKNIGLANAESFDVTLEVDGSVVDTVTVTSLIADDSTTVELLWTPGTTGNPTLTVTADSNNAVGESDETNNNLSVDVDVLEKLTATVDVRIEGKNTTVWTGDVTFSSSEITATSGKTYYFNEPTAIGALDEANKLAGFGYVADDSWGFLYITEVAGEPPIGWDGWMYRVNYVSPMIGAGEYTLYGGEGVLWYFGAYDAPPLAIELDKTTVEVGEEFVATVTAYNDTSAEFELVEGAEVYVNDTFYDLTGSDGTLTISISTEGTYNLHADKGIWAAYTRSGKKTLSVTPPYYTINLEMGWNLISIPDYIDPSNLSTVLKDVEHNAIYTYTPDLGWYTPKQFEPLYGYWINVTVEDQKINLTQRTDWQVQRPPPWRSMKEGWNLIGPNYGSGDDLEKGIDAPVVLVSLLSIDPSCSTLIDEDGNTYTILDDDGAFWELKLNAGEGYWLFMTKDDTLAGR
ncbi:MAG: hypothetical protein SYNGOMJ08_00283 [Candidatus Syntrophoarchaeum sp. GoM_oil]|nr:MAG: hypothetical protein SYNGOMJ08_00283 [Candidatus Syntrophoarchaeum sp. GoM_oil]